MSGPLVVKSDNAAAAMKGDARRPNATQGKRGDTGRNLSFKPQGFKSESPAELRGHGRSH